MHTKSKAIIVAEAVIIVSLLAVMMYRQPSAPPAAETATQAAFPWDNPPMDSLPDGKMGDYIKYGYQLITNTSQYIGPDVADPEMRFAGNNLDCQSCHLNAGTKKFAAPYFGLTSRFPQYRGRENEIGTIEDRINGCMERSMNGQKLPVESKEMKSMVAYMHWLSRGVAPGESIEGTGFVSVDLPNRRANLDHGKQVFETHCVACHQQDGQGMPANPNDPSQGHTFPPLWGEGSYNHGAGMHRVIKATRFIKGNMPLGATYDNPILTDEEAYDVAAYINSFDRPKKAHAEKDYPVLSKKPVDSPYPPQPDTFSLDQHKYGPFQPIIKARQSQSNDQ
jgi:thiosulfate dehydrogenase